MGTMKKIKKVFDGKKNKIIFLTETNKNVVRGNILSNNTYVIFCSGLLDGVEIGCKKA